MTDDDERLQAQYEAFLADEAADELAIKQAERQEHARDELRARRGARALRLPPAQDDYSLAELLTRELPDEPYAIDDVLKRHQSALFASIFTGGKTTQNNDMSRCLADGEPWLGRYDTHLEGNVGIFNAEMNVADDVEYWARLGVRNADRIRIWHLRGYRLDLLTDAGTEAAIDWLRGNEVGFGIIDPLQSLVSWSGTNSNDNDEVARLLDRIDQTYFSG